MAWQVDQYGEIREQVARLCANYPGEYWRALDAQRAYPTEFVQELTAAGFLAGAPRIRSRTRRVRSSLQSSGRKRSSKAMASARLVGTGSAPSARAVPATSAK